jgi:uncharacterized protein DUF5916/cellulose/xylan binding protein with CBM9 domain
MMKVITAALFALTVTLSATAQDRPEFLIKRAEKPIVIDGRIDDDAWKVAPLPLGDWLSYDPLYGQKQEQRTEVRISYDDRYLYFSFHCIDSEPDKVRTTISRRDNIFNDDWVGLSLDSGGNGQTSYHMMVNPSGIQMDALNTTASGERWEADWVWDSAGSRTDDGYSVELRVPLQSIRFKGGSEVRMGILFWRRISRLGVSASWPDIPPGQWVFNRHSHIVLTDLKQPPLIEVLPSVTQAINQTRNASSNQWDPAEGKPDFGLSAKYGITSSVTLDATYNPDFSQVESDAFQVQVNQRFPIFFSEKRPFFMEGLGLFNLAGSGGDGNMITGVHTRRIVNPKWGSKLTGSSGKFTFGMLSAADESPEDIGNRGAVVEGRNKVFTVGRALYGIGESNYVGAIVSDTEHAGRHNRVAGSDLSVRYAKRQQISAMFLSTRTATSTTDADQGTASQLMYSYDSRAFTVTSQTEHYDKGFQMDTSFYNRTGFTSNWTFAQINRYPQDSNFWVKRYTAFYWNKALKDRIENGTETFHLVGFRMNFTRQGNFRIDQGFGYEPFAGQKFKSDRLRLMGGVQITRWLNINGNFNTGWATFYDPVSPFQGKSRSGNLSVTWQPNSNFNQNISTNNVLFDRASTGERVFAVHIVNTRSTYQFNKHFFVRGIAQYDSSKRRVLTDFLASYELVPGSVMHAGYGSLIEKREAVMGYQTVSRGLFFKASYLHRF